jgi:hypothetical protein
LWAFHFSKRGLEKIITNTSVFSHHATPPALRRYPKLNLFHTENKPQQRRTGENFGSFH